MTETNNKRWLDFDRIEHTTLCHYDDREVFNANGGWLYSRIDGYDFKATEEAGYIRHWSDRTGDEEYIIKVPLPRLHSLYQDYLFAEGTEALTAYREWEYRDGEIIYSRIVT